MNWGTFKTLFRFGLVGVATNCVGYGFYLLLTALGVGPRVTMSILYIVGTVLGFLGNRKFAFKHAGSVRPIFAIYCIAYIVGYVIDFSMLYFFVERMGYSHQLVQAAAVLVVAAYLFTTLNLIVFSRQSL